jgi:hypothetical protein
MPLPTEIILVPHSRHPSISLSQAESNEEAAASSRPLDPGEEQVKGVVHGIILTMDELLCAINSFHHIFSDLIQQCESTGDRINQLSNRCQHLTESSDLVLPLDGVKRPQIPQSTFKSYQATTKNRSSSRKSRKSMLRGDIFQPNSHPVGIHLSYISIKNNNSSKELLISMDMCIPLLPNRYAKLRSHSLLYSDPNYFFNTWQEQQLLKLKAQKATYKRKKHEKEQIDFIRQLRADGPRPAVESIVSVAARRRSLESQSHSPVTTPVNPNAGLLGQIKPQQLKEKKIVQINWKDRFTVNGQPVHVKSNQTRSALHNYYTSYIKIAQRPSARSMDRLLEDDDSGHDGGYAPSEDTSDNMSLSSLSTSSPNTPKAIVTAQPFSAAGSQAQANSSLRGKEKALPSPSRLQSLPEDEAIDAYPAVMGKSSEHYQQEEEVERREGKFTFLLPEADSSPTTSPIAVAPAMRMNREVGLSPTSASVSHTAVVIPPPPPPPPPRAPAQVSRLVIPSSEESIEILADSTRVSIDEVILPALEYAMTSPRLSTPRLSGSITPTGKTLRHSSRFSDIISSPPPPPPPAAQKPSVSAAVELPVSPTSAARPPMSLLDAIRSGESRLRRVSEMSMSEQSLSASSASFMTASSANNLTAIFHSSAVNAILARRKFISESSSDEDSSGFHSEEDEDGNPNTSRQRRDSDHARRRSLSCAPVIRSTSIGDNQDEEAYEDAEDWI